MTDLIQKIFPDNQKTMCSVEIAELTGKRHDNVCADIEKMLFELKLYAPEFSGTQRYGNNNTRTVYYLPHRECDILMMGYSVEMRAKVYDRWLELENGKILTLEEMTLKVISGQKELIEKQQISLEKKDIHIINSNKASIKIGEVDMTTFVKENAEVLHCISAVKCFAWMRAAGFIFLESRQPKQPMIVHKYLIVRISEKMPNGKYTHQTYITPRGKVFFLGKFTEEINRDGFVTLYDKKVIGPIKIKRFYKKEKEE